MRKSVINKFFRRFGVELHGTGFIQSMQKSAFKDDAFVIQKQLIGDNAGVIFDVGANRGEITLKYQNLFKNAKIYAFEPYLDTFKILQSNLQNYKNIQIFQAAISETQDRTNLYVNKNVDTNSLLKPQKIGLSSDAEVKNISSVQVDSITIDEFCEINNIHQIDVLKMDIQGGELAALKGAIKLLKSRKIRLIYTETYFKAQYENHPLFFEIAAYLHQNNYVLQDLYNPIYGKGSIAWCDAIFLPAS